MTRKLRKLALGALLTGFFSAAAFGQITTLPVIDGDGTDAAWDQGMTWPLEAIIDVSTVDDAADFSGDVAVLWSADSLYVRVNVADEKLYVGGGDAYNYDNVCIYFDVFNKSTKSYVDSTQMYYEKNWWGPLTAIGGRYGTQWMAPPYGNFAVDTSSGTGYTIEMAIGWDEFDRVPAVGDKLGFDVKISDSDGVDGGAGRDQIAWRDKTDGGWNNPLLWGEIMLAADGSVEGMTDFVPTTDAMDANDRGWAFTPAWNIATVIDKSTITNAADCSGNVALLWSADSLYVKVYVADDILYVGGGDAYNYDNVCIYFDVFNKSTTSYVDSTQMYYEKNWWGPLTAIGGRYGTQWMAPPYGNFAVDTSSGKGYMIELTIGWDEFDRVPAVGDKLGFDVKISDNDGVDGGAGRDQLAWSDATDGGWNNPLLWGEITLAEDGVVSGQTVFAPTTDGVGNDRAWVDAVPMKLEREYDYTGVTGPADLSGTVKALWDPDNFYVLLEVKDDSLYIGGPNSWERDHYTVYFDVNNLKSTTYLTDKAEPWDSVQFNFEKPWSEPQGFYNWEGDTMVNGVDFVEVINNRIGYTLEMTVPMHRIGVTLKTGQVMGWDVKIGDNDGDGRDGMFSWNQLADEGWQNPSYLGEITLLANGTVSGTPETPPVDVTFNVDMTGMIAAGVFDPAVDKVDLAGSMNNWGDPVKNAADADADGIYTIVVSSVDVGTNLEFKFRVNGTWDPISEFPGGGPNRMYTAVEGENIVNVVFNDGDYTPWITGVDVNKASYLHMYPNPAANAVTLSSAVEIQSVKISNIAGQLVYKAPVNGFSTDVNITNLEAGMYIVSVTFESMEVSNRVLIKK
jgi:hypothetical protein